MRAWKVETEGGKNVIEPADREIPTDVRKIFEFYLRRAGESEASTTEKKESGQGLGWMSDSPKL